MDLNEYRVKHLAVERRKKRCMTCGLDPQVLKQIEAARLDPVDPVPYSVISKWLEHEFGIKIQHTTIRNHFIAGHVDA